MLCCVVYPVYSHNQAAKLNAKRSRSGALECVMRRTNFPPAAPVLPPPPPRPWPRRLRLGYISCNFMNHAQGTQLMTFFAHHDRSAFQVYAYMTRSTVTPEAREIEQIIARQCDHCTYSLCVCA